MAELIKGGAARKEFGALMGKAEPTKASKVEFIEPKIRPDAKRIRLTYGPYKLRAANVGVVRATKVALISSVEQGESWKWSVHGSSRHWI